jgi:hypothetical protein
MLYKALIVSGMTYTYVRWEYAMNIHLLKLLHLENKVLCATGNLNRRTLVENFRGLSKFLTHTTA